MPVSLIITAILNQTSLPVVVTPPPPPTPPVPIPLPPSGSVQLPPGLLAIPLIPPSDPATEPTPENSISLLLGNGAVMLLYTDGSGATLMSNVVPGATAVTLDRQSPPTEITLQIAPNGTPGDITAEGLVPIYNVTLV